LWPIMTCVLSRSRWEWQVWRRIRRTNYATAIQCKWYLAYEWIRGK
jgi:hypothetical protein